jgi:signal transduction histidine kinase
VALAEVIDRRLGDIVDRWLERVKEALKKRRVARSELRDAVPDYLRRIADALRASDPLEQGGATAWADVAREHALARVRLGFDVGELVHEFIILRQVLFTVAEEEGLFLDASQASRLADLLEAAVAVVVGSYVESRDAAASRREAEHIAFISHELRNPLGIAKLAADRLRSSASLGNEDKRALDLLERNLDRAALQIERVLRLERMTSGRIEAHPRPLSLDEILRGPLADTKVAADAKSVTLDVHVDADARVYVDPDLTASAVSNVLDNAVKYTDVGTIEVWSEEAPDEITLHIRDNCPGLSADELSVLFEPFERGRSSKPGTGLGLAIARTALSAEGGAIGAVARSGTGCDFWIRLPKENAREAR